MKVKKKPLIILSGPSGVGKSTMVKEILSIYGPKKMGTTITYTTRPPRGSEQEGRDYYFISEEKFVSLKLKNFFAEWAFVYNYYYGTALEQIDRHWKADRAIIKDFDLKGADTIKKLYPHTMRVFIFPPSIEELIHRVYKRSENKEEDIEVRIKQAEREMEQGSQFDHQLENINLPETVEKLKKVIEEYLKKV